MSKSDTLVSLALLDYDRLFHSDPDAKAIPCGEQSTISKSQLKEHIRELFQDGVKDLNFVASCECGSLIGNFYEGIRCSQCNTVVETNFSKQLKFRGWLEIPDFAPPILHPVFFEVLNRWIGKHNNASILEMLLNVDEELPKPLWESGLGKGSTYFYENFDSIMNYFINVYPPTSAIRNKKKTEEITQFITTFRDIAFIRHIPMLNQALHLLTSSGTMLYSDDCSESFLGCKIELSNMIYIHQNGLCGPKFIDQRMYEFYKSFLKYTETIGKVKLLGKTGYIRKTIMGTRLHCSARGVVIPMTTVHHYDEIHIPWKIGVTLLQLEIINVLMNRMDYNMPDALAKHKRALAGYDPDIDSIIQTLIQECKDLTGYRGLPFLLGRNPSLRLGAIQLVFVSKVKTIFSDDTLGISPLIVTAPNADFDGDCLHMLSIKEMDTVEPLMKVHPSATLLGGMSPGISGDICITKQAAINLNCWLNDPDAT